MKQISFSICFLFLNLLGVFEVYGQDSKPLFDHYFYKDGFKSSQALGVVKSKEGYLWIATESGLVRYDGQDFKTYTYDPNNSNSLPSNYLRPLKCDKYDRLWFFADASLCIYDIPNNKFLLPKVHPLIAKSFKLNLHYDEVYDKMWIMSENGLFFTYANKLAFEEVEVNFHSNIFNDIEILNDSIAYICSPFGLVEFNYLSMKPTNEYADPIENNGYMNIYRDNNLLWIGNWVNGLSVFDLVSKKILDFKWDEKQVQQTVHDVIRFPFLNDRDIVCLATNEGFKTFNLKNKKFTSFKSDNYLDKSQVSGPVFSFHASSKDGLWIGGYRGLHKYDPLKQIIKYVDLNRGLDENRDLRKIVFQRNERKVDSIVWLNYDYLELLKYDLKNRKIINSPKKLSPYYRRNLPVNEIFYDSKNRLWICNSEKKIVCYSEKKDELIIPSYDITSLSVFSISEDKNGNIFLGTSEGIFFVDETAKLMSIEPLSKLNKYLKKNGYRNYIDSPLFDSFGRHWYTCLNLNNKNEAIICYNPKKEQIIEYNQHNNSNLKGLGRINSFTKIGKDSFFIISLNQSLQLTLANDKSLFNKIQQKDGAKIYSNYVINDNYNNLWCVLDQGILHYSKNSKTYSEFNSFNSAIGNKIQPFITCSPNTGILYIAQDKGLNKLDVSDLQTYRRDKIKVSDVKIKNFIEDVKLENTSKLVLNHKQNSIDIRFSIFNFTNSNENSFQYRINSDSSWQIMSGNRLFFQELAFGDYNFEVRGVNSFGIITDNVLKFSITIDPPFYRRWWFNLLTVFTATFFIYYIFNYRDKQRQKLIQIRHAISRDLHDDMGSNLSHAKILSEMEALKNPHNSNFEVISKKLTEVMNNMSEIVWNTNPSNDKIEHVLDRIQEYAIDNLEPLGISVMIDFNNLSSQIKLDIEQKRHLYLIFKEAINNISKYSKASVVKLEAKTINKRNIISITDNGIGFDPLIIKQGNGLLNMQERANYLKALLKIDTNNQGTTIALGI